MATSRWVRAAWILFFILVTAKASAYWIGSLAQRPGDPFSTIVMYRGKDIESFPILKNLAYLGVGEPGLYEGHNEGVLSDRFIPWIPYSVLFRLAEAYGFVIADLLLTPLRFFLLAHLLKRAGVGSILSIATSAVLTCCAIDDFGETFPRFAGIPIRFWGLRLPRPFVSEFFLLLAMIGALAALNGLRERKGAPDWAWALAGASLALSFQSDFYSATGLSLAFVVILLVELAKSLGADRMSLFKGAGLSLLTALAFSIPGVIQSSLTNPEGMIRLGLFEVSRLHPPFIEVVKWYVAVAALGVVSWLITRSTAGHPSVRQRRQQAGRSLLLLTCWGALIAMPLTSVLLGKAIEVYHYRDSFTRYFSLSLVLVGLHALEALWGLAARSKASKTGPADDAGVEPKSLGALAATAAAVLCLTFIWQFATVNPTHADHMRSDYAEWAALENYRQPFVELVQELSKERYDNHPVMGTFDHQVWSWWVTFRNGYSYLADACTTNALGTELERRATALGRFVGMDRDQFATFVRRPYVMIFWMSCAKYQGTQAYSFAPIADYTPEDQKKIQTTPGFLNFTVALPLSQEKRLVELFESPATGKIDRLDLVVLTKDESMTGFAPPESEFELSFENRLFRVWTRRSGQATSAATR